MNRRPAFGRKFEERRLAGWDPPGPVIVGVELWLQRALPDFEVLVLAGDNPPELLDWRALAGCDVGVVYGAEDRELAHRTARAIAPRLVERLELVCWDERTVHECYPPWPDARLAMLDEPEAREYFRAMRVFPAHWSFWFWFHELELTRHCAGLDLGRKAERAA